MTKILSMNDIIQFPWGLDKKSNPTTLNKLPPLWRETRLPELDDIALWEQLYESNGTISVYAAFSPRANMFIIVPAINNKKIEVFYSEEELINRLQDFNIKLREYI